VRSLPFALFAPALACSPEEGVLVVDPPSVDWGEVDFQQPMPMEGYDQRAVNLINDGMQDLSIRIPGYDRVHLCLEGFEDQEGVIELPSLTPGSRYILLPAVCGYDVEAGEIGTTFHGHIQFVNDGADPVEMLEYDFTPVRHIGDDTGSR
jgi:hypothetical protein